MVQTGFFHHIGTFLLFVAVILLIVTDITAPVVNSLSIMRINLGNSNGVHQRAVTFGTFGYCTLDSASGDSCSDRTVGYPVSDIAGQAEGITFSQSARDTTTALTKVMILHPIATGICFIAFLLSLGAGFVGSLLASLVALLAFVVTAVVCITDFVLFSIIKVNVNDPNSGIGGDASYSAGIWTLLVAAICTLIAAIVTFLTCCSARFHRSRRQRATTKY